jgi:hypothetical protein
MRWAARDGQGANTTGTVHLVTDLAYHSIGVLAEVQLTGRYAQHHAEAADGLARRLGLGVLVAVDLDQRHPHALGPD